MFWRRRREGTDSTANRLSDEATPTELRWAAAGEADDEPVDADFEDDEGYDDEVDESDLDREEASRPDGDESEDDGLDLQEELAAQAEEFLTENDDWLYGENAEAVVALLERLEEVGPDESDALYEAWRAIPKAEREVARRAVRVIVDADADAERHARNVREAVGNWVAGAQDDPDWLEEDADWVRHCTETGEIAADAAVALVFENELNELDFDALYSPWANAIASGDATEDEEPEADDEVASGGAGAVGDAEESVSGGFAGSGASSRAADAPAVAGAPAPVKPGDFGPNTPLVVEFLNRLWLLPAEQVTRLIAAWEGMPRDQLGRAHDALHDLVDEDPAYRRQARKAQDQLVAWLNGGHRDETNPILGRTGLAATHRAAGPALADAVAALVVGDLLDRQDAEALYRPWFTLIGAPPLPEAAREDEDEAATGEERPSGRGRSGAAGEVDEMGPTETDADGEGEGEYGPNTDLVGELLDRVRALDARSIDRLAEAWDALPRDDLDDVHDAVQELADENPAWHRQVQAAQGEAAQRVTLAWSRGAGSRSLEPVPESAMNAIVDAVSALVLVDLLDAEDSELLYETWSSVVKRPKLPEVETES